jgi:hypothetical protein
VAELEDALQRERVDKVERLQVSAAQRLVWWRCADGLPQLLQAEAESEIRRLSGELQQMQVCASCAALQWSRCA